MPPDEPLIPTTDRLLELIDGMTGQPVAMLVDLVADRFVHGVPKRISREAPVLILQHEDEHLIPGGGANAVANVAALGGRPLPLGIVGDDRSGDGLLQIFEDRGISTAGIIRRTGFRTPTKIRILGGPARGRKQQIVRYDIEEFVDVSDAELARQLESLETSGGPATAAVLSDYGYGSAHPRLVPELRRRLGGSVPILGDSRYRSSELKGLDGITPNAEEAEALLEGGTGPRTPNALPFERDIARVESGGRALLDELGLRFLLITRGSAGMSLITAEPAVRIRHLPVHGSAQVADVTGAGDTVIGTFALALAAGGSPLEAACLANYAGGVVVMKMGTATLTPEELRAAVSGDPEMLRAIE